MSSKKRLGATGRFPHGRLGPDDQGELRAALAVVDGKIVIEFGKAVSWLAMMPVQARDMARLLLARADEAEGKTEKESEAPR